MFPRFSPSFRHVRTAYQRHYDMILSHGVKEYSASQDKMAQAAIS